MGKNRPPGRTLRTHTAAIDGRLIAERPIRNDWNGALFFDSGSVPNIAPLISILLGFGLVGMLANFAMEGTITHHLRLSLGAVVLLMVIAQVALPQCRGQP